MSIFTITFKGKLNERNKEDILDILIINLQGTSYEHIKRVGNKKLTVYGELISFEWEKRIPPFNIWIAFARKAEIIINENDEIYYSLDYTYGAISSIVVLFLFSIIFWINSSKSLIFISMIFYLFWWIAYVGAKFLIHRNLFKYSLKFGSRFKGKYDWNTILKAKSISELKSIASGNTTLTSEIQDLAIRELLRREEIARKTGT